MDSVHLIPIAPSTFVATASTRLALNDRDRKKTMKLKFTFLFTAFIATFLSTSAVAENPGSSGSNAAVSPITSELKTLQDKARKGDADAQYKLGLKYIKGDGLSRDRVKAMEWFQKAAEQGLAAAQYQLGTMYYFGVRENFFDFSPNFFDKQVPQDKNKALEWYQKAAAQGDADALYALYFECDYEDFMSGAPKNESKCFDLLQKAAAQGLQEAQFALAAKYADGAGVSTNMVVAYAWFTLAATQGVPIVSLQRDRIEKNLTIAQRAEGQRLAANWKKGDTLLASSNTADVQTPTNKGIEKRESSQKNKTGTVNWKSIGENTDQEVFIDTNSIRKMDGLVYVWEKTNFFKIQSNLQKNISDGRIVTFTLASWAINCNSHTIALVSSISKDANGDVIGRLDVEKLKFIGLPPESFGDKIINAACSEIPNLTPSSSPAKNESENNTSPKLSSTGSGFVVSASGYLLTNHHVANDCTILKIRDSSKTEHDVTVIATDARNDLALLQIIEPVALPAAIFRANSSVETGENVVALGYPLAGILASEVNVSFGHVSATAGLADDTGMLQISAPVQPGNSGGPLLDQAGNLIGVVVAKLDAIKVAKAIGDIPQNINFAVKGEVAQVFLKAHKVKFKIAATTKKLGNTDIASRGRAFTVLVECYK